MFNREPSWSSPPWSTSFSCSSFFFIVTWQFARFERDMDISVPAAEETTDEPRNVGEIIVNVREDGSIVLNGLEVSEEELLAK